MGTSDKRQERLQSSSAVASAFARRLKQWRVESGLPLKHVARDLGVSVSIVCEWEHAHRFPSIANLESIARYMELPVCCVLYQGQGVCPHARSGAGVRVNGKGKSAGKARCR